MIRRASLSDWPMHYPASLINAQAISATLLTPVTPAPMWSTKAHAELTFSAAAFLRDNENRGDEAG